jgi:hypothetical protein
MMAHDEAVFRGSTHEHIESASNINPGYAQRIASPTTTGSVHRTLALNTQVELAEALHTSVRSPGRSRRGPPTRASTRNREKRSLTIRIMPKAAAALRPSNSDAVQVEAAPSSKHLPSLQPHVRWIFRSTESPRLVNCQSLSTVSTNSPLVTRREELHAQGSGAGRALTSQLFQRVLKGCCKPLQQRGQFSAGNPT